MNGDDAADGDDAPADPTAGGTPPGNESALWRLLGGPDTAWLLHRVRARLPAADEPLAGVVVLPAPTAAQRAAVTRLVGRARRGGSTLRVELADVETILRRGPWPAGLADAVEVLTGPVVDVRAERDRAAAAWARAADGIGRVGPDAPGFRRWWDSWCAAGGLKRVARAEAARLDLPVGPDVAEALVGQLAQVLASLPAAGVPLSVFARRTAGDAHGLDDSRPLGRLATAAVGVAFRGSEATPREVSRRDAWAGVGVVLSNVSSTVLTLGVPGRAAAEDPLGAATATALEAMAGARAPMLLTLDQVRSGGVPAVAPGRVVHVCENPTVVEVVAGRWAELGSGSTMGVGTTEHPGPVLVCTSGQPSTAVVELLGILTGDGASYRYHGDFDWHGLRIATTVRALVGRPWTPWRYTAADYRAALSQDHHSSLRLTGRPTDAPWDPGLAPAMAAAGLAVEEESVAGLLAADLLGPD